MIKYNTGLTSVPSRVRNLRKMRNFWANFTDFKPEIYIIKCKTEKLKQKKNLNSLMQDCSLYLEKANLMQKIGQRGPQSSEILGKNFNEFIICANSH